MKVQINLHSKQVFSPKQCAEGNAFLFIILAFMLLLYGGYEYNLHIMKSFFSKKKKYEIQAQRSCTPSVSAAGWFGGQT